MPSTNLCLYVCVCYSLFHSRSQIKMPRKYKRKEDSRKYGFSSESMQKAIEDIQANNMSVKKAAFLHGLNRSTVINHLKQQHTGKVGRPTVLAPNEEALIVHALLKLGDWGFGVPTKRYDQL